MDDFETTNPGHPAGSATCEHGHVNPAGQGFCGECGAPLTGARVPEPTTTADAGAEETAPTSATPEAADPGVRRFVRPRVLVPVGLLLLLLVGGAVALTSSEGGSDSHDIVGTLTLTDTDEYWSDGDPCAGSGGYDDIRAGAQVVVKDQEGKLLATSDLLPGAASSDYDCDFAFVVIDVPDADFYSIEISHRGEITNSRQEMEDNGWIVGLTLGD